MSKEISQVPLYSVVSDGKREAPVTPERFLEEQLDQYLKSLPEEQQNFLQSAPVREGVSRELGEIAPLLPLLERMTAVTERRAARLGVEGGKPLKDLILRREIAKACRMALLADENRILREKIKIDPLTELANRRGYDERVSKDILNAVKDGKPLWCLMADLDHFRKVNTQYGHTAGDEMLREVGRRFRSQMRFGDFFARCGGEEFIALSTENDDGVRRVALRTVEIIGQEPFVVKVRDKVRELRITVSVGGSRFRVGEDEGKTEMEERADRNLYMAKDAGRNRAFLENEELTAKGL